MSHGSSSIIPVIRSRGCCDGLTQHTKQKIGTEKCLVSILWLVNRIQSLCDVPKGTASNIAFFIDTVMPSLTENRQSLTRGKTLKIWLVHRDDARPHNSGRAQKCMEASRAERRPHPNHSPDRSPSDFSSLERSKENYLITSVRTESTPRTRSLDLSLGGVGQEALPSILNPG
jgi:hypothetical protein